MKDQPSLVHESLEFLRKPATTQDEPGWQILNAFRWRFTMEYQLLDLHRAELSDHFHNAMFYGFDMDRTMLRQEIVERHHLRAIISLPSGIFKPYAGVSTGIMVFDKTGIGGTDQVWFYGMAADGYSLDDKRQPIQANDIPDIIQRFHHLDAEAGRPRTAASFPRQPAAGSGLSAAIPGPARPFRGVEGRPAVSTWPMVRLGDYVQISSGELDANAANEGVIYPI
jgi:hypothetical protein